MFQKYIYIYIYIYVHIPHISSLSAHVAQELHNSFAEDLRWSQLPWFPGAWQCDAKDYDDALRSQCSALNKSYALRFQERVGYMVGWGMLVGKDLLHGHRVINGESLKQTDWGLYFRTWVGYLVNLLWFSWGSMRISSRKMREY